MVERAGLRALAPFPEWLESESSSVCPGLVPSHLRQPNSGAVCPHAKNQCHAADNR
ncbi:hypothetical protein EMIT048CA2_310055 [Pseudomonas chlororaphis]